MIHLETIPLAGRYHLIAFVHNSFFAVAMHFFALFFGCCLIFFFLCTKVSRRKGYFRPESDGFQSIIHTKLIPTIYAKTLLQKLTGFVVPAD